MNLTTRERVFKLVHNLTTQPSHLPKYLSCLPVWGRYPSDLEMPWWSFAAIDFLKARCRPEMTVFEYGSGGSTLFFAGRCKSVTAAEDDAEWQAKLSQSVKAARIENVEILLRPFDFRAGVGFASSSYLQTLDKSYDIIVVDGQDWPFDTRPVCFARAEEYIREGGMIVVDDSWRYPQLRKSNRAKSFEVFESVGPCRVGVTSTDIYFY